MILTSLSIDRVYYIKNAHHPAGILCGIAVDFLHKSNAHQRRSRIQFLLSGISVISQGWYLAPPIVIDLLPITGGFSSSIIMQGEETARKSGKLRERSLRG